MICALCLIATLGIELVLEVVMVILGVLEPAPAPCITPTPALPCPFEPIDGALDGFSIWVRDPVVVVSNVVKCYSPASSSWASLLLFACRFERSKGGASA